MAVDLKGLIGAMKGAGQSDALIIDRLIKNPNISDEAKEVMRQHKGAKTQTKGVQDLMEILDILPQVETGVTPLRSLAEQPGIRGTIGKVAKFTGAEPLARTISGRLSGLTQEQTGVSGRQLAGSIAQTGLSLLAPVAGRALTGGKVLGRVVPALNLPSRLGGEALLGAGFGAAGAAQEEEGDLTKGAITGAAIGAGLPIIGNLALKIGRFGTELITDLLERTTSIPQQALKEILSASSRAERQAISAGAAGRTTPSQIAEGITKATNLFRKERDVVYKKGREALQKLYPEAKEEAKQSFISIRNSFRNLAEQRGIVFDKNKIVSIPPRASKAVSGAASNIKKAWESILNFERKGDFSVSSIDDLAQDLNALSNFQKGIITDTTPVVSSVSRKLQDEIKKVYPELSQLRKFYSERSTIINTFDDVFKAAKTDVKSMQAAINKVQTLFNQSNSEYLNALKRLDAISGTNLVKQAAGVTAQKEAPGILRTSLALGGAGVGAALISPYFLLLLPLFSPRIVQSVLRNSTIAKPVQEAIISALGSTAIRPLTGAVEAQVSRTLSAQR